MNSEKEKINCHLCSELNSCGISGKIPELFEDRSIEAIKRYFEQQRAAEFPTLVCIKDSSDKNFTKISLLFFLKNQLYQSSRKFNSRIFSDDYISLVALDLIRNSIQN